MSIIIHINGKSEQLPSKTSLSQLLKKLVPQTEAIAISLNGKIISSDHWHNTVIEGGEQLEILTAVMGG